MNAYNSAHTDYSVFDLLIKSNLHFALFRFPNSDKLHFVMQKSEKANVSNHLTDLNALSGFVIAPFHIAKSAPLIIISPDIELEGEGNIINFVREINYTKNNSHHQNTPLSINATREIYNCKFDKFKSALSECVLDKIVLSRSIQKSIDNTFSAGNTFRKALEKYPNNFVYLTHTPETGCWLGSSPELLVSGEGSRHQTVALAGTQNILESSGDWDTKNKSEQQIVTDYMKEQLETGKYNYSEGKPFSIQSGNLRHLKTEFSFEMNEPDKMGDLLQLLHPSPAICGYPKEETLDFILRNEGYDRRYYSGFLGCLNMNSRTNLFVNLRCMQIHPNSLTLYAGGGILPSSDVDTEWTETENKLQTMLSILEN